MAFLSSLGKQILRAQEAILRMRKVSKPKQFLHRQLKRIPGIPETVGGSALIGGGVGALIGSGAGFGVGRARRPRKYAMMPDRYDELVRRAIMHPKYIPLSSRFDETNDDLTEHDFNPSRWNRRELDIYTGAYEPMAHFRAMRRRKESPTSTLPYWGHPMDRARKEFLANREGHMTPAQHPRVTQIPDRYLSEDQHRGTFTPGWGALKTLERLGHRQKQFYMTQQGQRIRVYRTLPDTMFGQEERRRARSPLRETEPDYPWEPENPYSRTRLPDTTFGTRMREWDEWQGRHEPNGPDFGERSRDPMWRPRRGVSLAPNMRRGPIRGEGFSSRWMDAHSWNRPRNFSNTKDVFKRFTTSQPRWSDMDINEKRRLVQASVRSGREKALLLAGITREEHGN